MQPEALRKEKDILERLARLESYQTTADWSGTAFPPNNLFDKRPFYRKDLATWFYYSLAEFSGPAPNWYYMNYPVFTDSFNRANSTTTMGRADSKQSWVNQTGTGGITSNQAYFVTSANNNLVLAETGIKDQVITCQMSGTINDAVNYLVPQVVFHALDNTTFLDVQLHLGFIYLQKLDGGVSTNPANAVITTVTGQTYTIVIVCNLYAISIYVDGVLKISYTLAGGDVKYAEYTKIGIRQAKNGAPGTDSRWDNFIVRQAA